MRLTGPVSAVAFSVYAFGTLATNLNLDQWQHPASLALIALALPLFARSWRRASV